MQRAAQRRHQNQVWAKRRQRARESLCLVWDTGCQCENKYLAEL